MNSIEKRLTRLETRRKPTKQEGRYISVLPEAEEIMQKSMAACSNEYIFYRCVGSAHALIISEREERNPENIERDEIDLEIAERAVMLLSDCGITV